jgi:hypothetical protein
MTAKHLSALFSLMAVLLLATTSGCKKKNGAPDQAFKNAGPETQARWQQASEAAKTNGYVTAVLTLRKLQIETYLTPDQQAAITALMMTVNESLAVADQAGEPEAKKAMEEIRQRWRTP